MHLEPKGSGMLKRGEEGGGVEEAEPREQRQQRRRDLMQGNNYFSEMCSGSEAGSHLRIIDFCKTPLYRLESNKEEKAAREAPAAPLRPDSGVRIRLGR